MAYTLAEFRFVVDMLDAGHLEPRAMVTSVIGLDDLAAKIAALRGGSAETKVRVDPWLRAD